MPDAFHVLKDVAGTKRGLHDTSLRNGNWLASRVMTNRRTFVFYIIFFVPGIYHEICLHGASYQIK
jgi:hypothetical protein